MKTTSLFLANQALKEKNYEIALKYYSEAINDNPKLKNIYAINIKIAKKGLDSVKKIVQPLPYKNKEKISGGMNSVHVNSTHLGGWVAYLDSKIAPEIISLKIDNKEEYVAKVNKRRTDLSVVGLPSGNFGFSLKIPEKYYDDKKHEVSAINADNGDLIFKSNFKVNKTPQFDDFAGMMARALVDPMINAPFLESDKRALAFADVLVKNWASKALSVETDKVTILLPVFNRAEIVSSAINSILQQTYSNWELIIIDDGSVDRSVEVLKNYTDLRIKLVLLPINKGKSAALNEGLKYATGKWVAYLDSDNKWHPQYLAASLGAALERPDVDAFFSGQYLYEGSAVSPYAVRIATYNKNLFLNRNYIDHNSFFHKREIFEKIGYYSEDLRRYLDYEFIMRVSTQCKMASLPFALTDYYFDAVADTITGNQKLASQFDLVLEKAQEALTTSPKVVIDSIRNRKVTVVIPSYNSKSDLIKCIETIESSP
jgi:glycosyltransferase involved in cell wall biosynthesis